MLKDREVQVKAKTFKRSIDIIRPHTHTQVHWYTGTLVHWYTIATYSKPQKREDTQTN